MSVIDVQMQIWRANLDLWRRLVDTQLTVARGVMEASTAWTWRAVDTAREIAELERDRTAEVVETATRALHLAEATRTPRTAAPTLPPEVDVMTETAETLVEAVTETAATMIESTTELVEVVGEAVVESFEAATDAAAETTTEVVEAAQAPVETAAEVVEAARDSSEAAAETVDVTAEPAPMRAAPARRTTMRTATAPKGRRKPS